MAKTMKYREFDRLSRLEDRRDYLANKVKRKIGSAGAIEYATGELSALRWAIPIMEAYLIKKHTAQLDTETLKAIKGQIPEHLYKQLMKARE